jgi:hypothetical protein
MSADLPITFSVVAFVLDSQDDGMIDYIEFRCDTCGSYDNCDCAVAATVPPHSYELPLWTSDMLMDALTEEFAALVLENMTDTSDEDDEDETDTSDEDDEDETDTSDEDDELAYAGLHTQCYCGSC